MTVVPPEHLVTLIGDDCDTVTAAGRVLRAAAPAGVCAVAG
ncbi:hypothetical protein [Micromonospora sp. KC721]|nr:hypothetical protein [Micromonospora sp. KC721]